MAKSTDHETKPAVEEKPTKRSALPEIDDEAWAAMKAWVREEVELARHGIKPDERAERNP